MVVVRGKTRGNLAPVWAGSMMTEIVKQTLLNGGPAEASRLLSRARFGRSQPSSTFRRRLRAHVMGVSSTRVGFAVCEGKGRETVRGEVER